MGKNTLVLFSFFVSVVVAAKEVLATFGDSCFYAIAKSNLIVDDLMRCTCTPKTNDLKRDFYQPNWKLLVVQDFVPYYPHHFSLIN
jgi:hypothetical protein